MTDKNLADMAPTIMDEKGEREAWIVVKETAFTPVVDGAGRKELSYLWPATFATTIYPSFEAAHEFINSDPKLPIGWVALRLPLPAVQPEAETSAEKAVGEGTCPGHPYRSDEDIIADAPALERKYLPLRFAVQDLLASVLGREKWEEFAEDLADLNKSYAELVMQTQADAPVAEPVALKDEQHEKEMLAVIDERDKREEVINAILDEVLGLDRHEWSSAYGFADAVEDVKTRMHAIECEHSGLESEIEDLRAESWPDWANQVLKIVRAQSGYDGYDDADGVDIPGEVQELADEYSRTFTAMETFRKERDEARAARPPAPEEGKDAAQGDKP